MRISSLQYFQSNTGTMQKLQAELIKTQEQVSSGFRVEKPSDDPANIFRALSAEKGINDFEQYSRNSIFAQNRFEQMDTYMKNFSETLLSVKDTLVQAGAGTNSESDFENFSLILREARKEMYAVMNSQDVDGKFIFSGKAETTQPYDDANGSVYQAEKNKVGQSAGNQIQISTDVFVDTGVVGSDLFTISQTSLDQNGDEVVPNDEYNVLQAMDDLIDIFESGSANSQKDAIRSITEDLNLVFDKVQLGRSIVGIRLNTIEKVTDANLAVRDSYEEIRAGARDIDLAAAITKMTQGKAQLEAAQLAFTQTSRLSLFNFIA